MVNAGYMKLLGLSDLVSQYSMPSTSPANATCGGPNILYMYVFQLAIRASQPLSNLLMLYLVVIRHIIPTSASRDGILPKLIRA